MVRITFEKTTVPSILVWRNSCRLVGTLVELHGQWQFFHARGYFDFITMSEMEQIVGKLKVLNMGRELKLPTKKIATRERAEKKAFLNRRFPNL